MSRIIKEFNKEIRDKNAKHCREQNVIIPTFAQMRNPDLIPEEIKAKLDKVGLWDIDPINLFRITWKNNMDTGRYGKVNYFEIPSCVTGVKARIVGLVGKYFPTGAHKVGAAFGCLVPRLVNGEYDPQIHKAVWPSTGNYCRGGAFDSALLGCHAIAILPEEMSQERFTWLKQIGTDVIATPGCESNVKEIYDKCNELSHDPLNFIFNQFAEFGNPLFHHQVTGPAIQEVFEELKTTKSRLAAYISATGSAGTIAAGDFLKLTHPLMKTVASEALQCPTLLRNGFGGHRIEGIGDKHVPWVHNVRNTDLVAAIDDEDCMRVMRLFNEKTGQQYLREQGVSEEVISKLPLLGISGISNMLSAIKTAKYYEMDENDIIFTIFTDSMEMYQSRVEEQTQIHGAYKPVDAAVDFHGALFGQKTDNYLELTYQDRKRIHNLKYYTWVEQQGKTFEELNEQWNPEYWTEIFFDEIAAIEEKIVEFNKEVGLL